MARKEIEDLRKAMREGGVDLCVIPTADAHESEYPGDHFAARRYLSGFTGSAGTLAVSRDWAGLWTDARYFLQAAKELSGSGIVLYRMGEEGVPTLCEEILSRMPRGGGLAYDGKVVNRRLGTALREIAGEKEGRVLLADLPGKVWEGRPDLLPEPVFELPVFYSGESRKEKLERVRTRMKEAGADVHILTTLDDIAWMLNLRGNDIPCNPVFLSYLILEEESGILFAGAAAISDEIRKNLEQDGIRVEDYESFYDKLGEFCTGKTVMLDSRKVNDQVFEGLKENQKIVDKANPSELMKAVKNETEIENMKKAHVKDGVAVTKFLYWLKEEMKKNLENPAGGKITELGAAEKLELFRREQKNYLEPSFETIAAYGANGAIVHYTATEETDTELKPEGFLLVDSGGQYLEGTTDITRTIVLGPVTKDQKKHFTAVLKGMLALGDAHFLKGCRGVNLDYLARKPLWDMGLDFKHGTGHGVGFLLNVHEAPNGFRWKMVPERMDSAVLEAGMITSDEPGVYLEGRYGIRTENLLLCREAEKTEYGSFLAFDFLTMVPIDLEGIDWSEMEPEDIRRLNRYHERVYKTLSPYFSGKEKLWLAAATKPHQGS